MTATLILVRHAAHGHLGDTLSGRLPGLSLTEAGVRQAARLAHALAGAVAAVQSSPLARARKTAEAIAAAAGGGPVEVVDALTEIDFGGWTGRRFADLEADPAWRHWNGNRASARAPGGESMAEAQARIVGYLRETARRHAGASVAVVTHCDLIRSAVAHVLGLTLDNILSFDVDPASMTRVAIGDWGARLVSLNEKAG